MAFSVEITGQCHSCGVCMDVCPTRALDMTSPSRSSIEGGPETKPWMMEFPVLMGLCTGCRMCEVECPFEAIRVVSSAMPIREAPADAAVAAAMAQRARQTPPRHAGAKDWREFHSLSSLTRDTYKRPVRSPFPSDAGWKPWVKRTGRWRVWRNL